jgi:mediator of RNA polymerase II transcription subunit 12
MDKIRYLDDPAMRFVLPLLLQFGKEFVKSELLSRKMAYNCARKLTSLVSDTDALASPDAAGASALHPVMAAFGELMEDPYTRFILFGLSSIIQIVTLECPTALVWNYFGEMKSPSSLLGSPLDFLPNCAPSGLPMPPRQNSQAVRARLKQAESMIKERSIAVESE